MDANDSIGCWILFHAANEGPVRIQYKCLVPILSAVFPEMKLCSLLISKTELHTV
jgi:hypothetical protein